jgi:hypothetical protein
MLLGKDLEQMASGPIAVRAAIARAGGEARRVELAITQQGERRLRRLVALPAPTSRRRPSQPQTASQADQAGF